MVQALRCRTVLICTQINAILFRKINNQKLILEGNPLPQCWVISNIDHKDAVTCMGILL